MATNLPSRHAPSRPAGLLPSHRPPSALVPATTVAAPPAERYLSPLPCTTEGEGGREDRLPVTPPSKFKRFKIFIKSAGKERKRDERQYRDKKRAAPPLTHNSWSGQPSVIGPQRRSYRLTGGAPDPGCEYSMLPLWLEETNGTSIPTAIDCIDKRETFACDQDTSFEKRWDSLRNKSKIHSSCQTQRPPGWDDVNYCSGRGKKERGKKSSFCPSIVIQEPGRVRPTSPLQPLPAPPVFVRTRAVAKPLSRSNETNPLDLRDFSERVGNFFPDSFVEVSQHTSSTSDTLQPSSTTDQAEQSSCTSNMVPDSSTSNMSPRSTSIGDMAVHSSTTTNVSDCHMWTSSDSFFCENFTFCDTRLRESQNIEVREQKLDLQCPARPISPDCGNELTYCEELEVPSPEMWTASEESLASMTEEDQVSTTSVSSRQCDYEYSSASSSHCSIFTDNSVGRLTCKTNSTLCIADAAPRQHWVKFDGNLNEHNRSVVSKEIISTVFLPGGVSTPFPSDDGNHRVLQAPLRSPPSASTPSLPFLENTTPCTTHTSGSFSGRLVRTYSQRGRRASKRVIDSVSRRMSVSDYGKLAESKPPMYSKAVLTMQGGPGLFEEPPPRADTECPQSPHKEKLGHAEVSKLKENPPSTYLELSASPQRVGSVRVPRLPATLLRRSLSLNTQRVKQRDVPFQRLPEQRQGSFRRAISGIGALARSFRRKSNNAKKEEGAVSDSQVTSPNAGLEKIGGLSVADVDGQRTPQAPRLPRRATNQRYGLTQDSDRLVPVVCSVKPITAHHGWHRCAHEDVSAQI